MPQRAEGNLCSEAKLGILVRISVRSVRVASTEHQEWQIATEPWD